MRLVFGDSKTSRSLPGQILKSLYRVLKGFSNIYDPDGLNNTLLSQGYIPEVAPSVGRVSGTYIPRMGRG